MNHKYDSSQNSFFSLWMGHFVDFFFFMSCLCFFLLASRLFIHSYLGIFMAPFEDSGTFLFTFILWTSPFVGVSYFFSSYLLNDGQSLGNYLFQKRISFRNQASEISYREVLKWSFESCLFCFTGGLSFLFQRKYWRHIKSHDYKYQELMNSKNMSIQSQISPFKQSLFFSSKEDKTCPMIWEMRKLRYFPIRQEAKSHLDTISNSKTGKAA